MPGSGLAAPASILAAMLVLADGLRATRFPLGLTVAVIRGQRATGPAREHAKRPRHPVAKKFIAVSHPSKRLYVDSAVALDASSGKLRRDFQPVPEDFYDWSPCAAARAGCRVAAKYVATNTNE